MRRTPFVVVAGLLVLSGLIGFWLLAVRVLPTPNESRWIDGIYQRKEAAAAAIVGPKAVIVGGSGSHFSYSARVVGEATGLPVVNLGTHAGLGAEYILHRARASLKPGDTAIVALEHQLAHATKPSSLLATFVLTSDPAYLLSAPARDLPALLFGYPPVQVLRQMAAASVPSGSPLYRAETVDGWGDETANSVLNKLPYMADIVRSLPVIGLPAPDPSKPPSYLIEFARWARDNDVRLLEAWPTTTFRPDYLTPHFAGYFEQYAEMYRRLGFTVLGRPNSYFIPEDEMLDSMYHADTSGARRASLALAVDLCHVLVCPKKHAGATPN